MTPPLSYYSENADSVNVGAAGFQLTNAKATATYYLLGEEYPSGQVTTSDIPDAITQIIGGTSTDIGDGTLERTLPLAHPLYPWLYADGVTIRGFGAGYMYSGAQELEAPPFPDFTAYPNYQFDVQFTPRSYVIASDASVPTVPLSFYNTAGEEQEADVAGEWVRYTDWWYERKFESITSRQGQMMFRTETGNPPNGICYSDMPKLFLPDSLLKIVWYQIPYRYIYSENSYIDGLIGFINQNVFTTWPVGSLLYIGYTAKRYTPPVQELSQIYTGSTGYVYSAEKLCDVELLFLRTKRTLPSDGEAITPSNPNWVVAGWNLLPWLVDRKFHYATSFSGANPTETSSWTPMFPSTELSLLFTDPDAAGAFQVANL